MAAAGGLKGIIPLRAGAGSASARGAIRVSRHDADDGFIEGANAREKILAGFAAGNLAPPDFLATALALKWASLDTASCTVPLVTGPAISHGTARAVAARCRRFHLRKCCLPLNPLCFPRRQQWLKSAITIMIGIGTPIRKSKIERIVDPPFLPIKLPGITRNRLDCSHMIAFSAADCGSIACAERTNQQCNKNP